MIRVHGARGKIVEQTVLVSAGEKLKIVEVWLEPRTVPVVRTRRPVPTGTYLLLGVGAAALASFGTFAIWTTIEFQNSSTCAPTCNPSTHDGGFDAKTAVADVSLAVSAAALVGAVIVYLTRPRVTEPSFTPRFAGASLTWRF